MRRITLACLLLAGLAGSSASAADVVAHRAPRSRPQPDRRKGLRTFPGTHLPLLQRRPVGRTGLGPQFRRRRSGRGLGRDRTTCSPRRGWPTDVRLVFGEPTWTDYEFTVEARKTGGDEGFLILLRALNAQGILLGQPRWLGQCGACAGTGNQGARPVGCGHARAGTGRSRQDRWYRIRARCEGRRIQVWLDDDLVIDYTDDGRGPASRRCRCGNLGHPGAVSQFQGHFA